MMAARASGSSAGPHGSPAASERIGAAATPPASPAGRANGNGAAGSLFPPPGITSTRPVFYSNGIRRYADSTRRGRERGSYGGVGLVTLGYPGYFGLGYDADFDFGLSDQGGNPNMEAGSYGPVPVPEALANPQAGTAASAEQNGSLPSQTEPDPPPYVAAPRAGHAAPAESQAPLPEEDAVTIVFKDGRPPEQIRNYALTRTTLYLTAGRVRVIPVDQIDLPATEKINQKAGVEFHLPFPR